MRVTERGAILAILVLVGYGGLIWWLASKSPVWLVIVVVGTLSILTGAEVLKR